MDYKTKDTALVNKGREPLHGQNLTELKEVLDCIALFILIFSAVCIFILFITICEIKFT